MLFKENQLKRKKRLKKLRQKLRKTEKALADLIENTQKQFEENIAAKHHRLYDEITHLHKSELMKIRNKKAHQTEMNALGISGIAAMEQIENEELEEE